MAPQLPDRYASETRILGLDVGDRRIGIARSDPLGILASPMGVYHRRDLAEDLDHLETLVAENNITKVVVGLPVNMSGSEGSQAAKTREFAQALIERGLAVELWDERLTTVEATRMLSERGMNRKRIERHVDELAATLILESYLARQREGRT